VETRAGLKGVEKRNPTVLIKQRGTQLTGYSHDKLYLQYMMSAEQNSKLSNGKIRLF
jgi:hypothetical protein